MDAPVTLFIIIILIFVHFTGTAQALTDCSTHTIPQYMKHSLVHADIIHLAVNLITFISLIYMEKKYGSTKYSVLIIILLFLSSFIHLFIHFGSCSVGFSGVLIGLIIYHRMISNNFTFDIDFFKQLGFLLLVPWLMNPRISLTGHTAGAIAGLMLALVY